MKKVLSFFCTILCATALLAQSDGKELTSSVQTSMNRAYIRPTITRIYITDNSQYANSFAQQFATAEPSKFNTIEAKNKFFHISKIPTTKKEQDSCVHANLDKIFNQEKVSNQIIHAWFPEFDDTRGAYTTKVLLEKGRYAMTDEDVATANSSSRSMETFATTFGRNLIDRSYVVCFLITENVNAETKKSESVNITPYVYKLDYGAKVATNFQRNYFKKANGIDECQFPLIHVLDGKRKYTASIPEEPTNLDWEEDFDNSMVLVNEISDFQVKATVLSAFPITAKIGTKEGLYVDQRFNVVRLEEEFVTDDQGNTTTQQVANRRATVRVKKVVDNKSVATGETEGVSKFYKTRGYMIREGYTLVENKDMGLGVAFELSYAHPNITIDYRLGRFTNIPGLLAFVRVGLNLDLSSQYNWNYYFLNTSIGVAKEINFAPFTLTPSIEVGKLMATSTETDTEIDLGYFAALNAKLGFYVTQASQVYFTLGYNLFLSNPAFPLNVGIGFKYGF